MDALKNIADKVSNSSSSTAGTTNTGAPAAGGAAPAGNAGQEDYLDKGLDAGEKKFGYAGNRETNEKVTDFARGQFEKATGKHVPEKFSN